MKRASVLLAVAACGRVGFDPEAVTGDALHADAPGCSDSHDEDGDGIDDSCDVCPHVSDVEQGDRDGDRVGDACDPEPDLSRQELVLFDAFITADPSWMTVGTVAVMDDHVQLGGTDASGVFFRRIVPEADTFVIGGETMGTQTQRHLIAVIAGDEVGPGSFYCELYDDGAAANLFFTVTTDGTTFDHPAGIPISRFASGSGRLHFDLSPTTVGCATTWSGNMATLTSSRPAQAADIVSVYAENVLLRLRYFVHIRTRP